MIFLLAHLCLLIFVDLCTTDDPNRELSNCEVCKYLAKELVENLQEHSSSMNLQLSYRLDNIEKRKIKYNTSETRLTEVLDTVCRRILDYNVHAERPGSLRYAKGRSQTMDTLWNLRKRGVKVVLDVPEDLWDHPSAEITNLEKHCDIMLEKYEDVISDWYFHHQNIPLEKFLCEDVVLKNEDASCLTEVYVSEEHKDDDHEETEDATKDNVAQLGTTVSKEIKKEL